MQTVIFILVIIVITLGVTFFNNRQTKFDNGLQIANNFSSYLAILQYYMEKSYNIVYKEKIMVYSMDASKLDEKNFIEASKQFCKLTIKMMGPRFFEQFYYFFGSEESFLFNLTQYFNERIEDDPIRQASIDKLMEKNESEENKLNEIFKK